MGLPELKLLDEYLETEKFKELLNRINVLSVFKIEGAEIRHSNILGWLLDPNANHGMGSKFLEMFLKDATGNAKLNMDYSTFSVYREHFFIDLVLVSEKEKKIIAIENKIKAQERKNQLKDYREVLEREYAGYERELLFYLTLDLQTPSDEKWKAIDYGIVIKTIEQIEKEKTFFKKLKPDAQMIIKHYKDALGGIMGTSDLAKECLEIYKKHKTAIDLIIQNIPDNNGVAGFVKNALQGAQKGKYKNWLKFNDRYSNNTYIRITTSVTEKYFPQADDTKSGPWNNGYPFMYEIVVEKNKIRLIGTLAEGTGNPNVRKALELLSNKSLKSSAGSKILFDSRKFPLNEPFKWCKILSLQGDVEKYKDLAEAETKEKSIKGGIIKALDEIRKFETCFNGKLTVIKD